MSWNPSLEPTCPSAGDSDSIETLIIPRARDLGGFEVRRALPAPRRQMVGSFIFFDQMGPAEFLTGQGIDVRPHPHIGIATVTYLFHGEFQHRDSLGTDQMIYPGEVNWMIAGGGITHSERTSAETRESAHSLFGIQTWVALPDKDEETTPAFEHHGKDALPLMQAEGKTVRLILGRAYGETAPVKTFTDMFYADARLDPCAAIPMPDDHEDRGVYVTEGSVSVGDDGSVTFDGVLKKVTESMLTSFPHHLLGTWIPNRAAIRYDREQIEGRRVKIFESGKELDLEGVLALAR